MSEAFSSQLGMMLIALLLEIPTVFLTGLIAIPLLRSKKTGRLEWRIGKRFKTDGSEPSMGGVVMGLGFALWYFPAAAVYDIKGSITQNSRGDLIFAGIYVIIILCVGALEDRQRRFIGRPAGLPLLPEQLLIFSLSLVFLLLISEHRSETAVLLPFNLGFINAGVLYYPLTAVFMTAAVDVFKLHFCFGNDYSGAVGGLVEFTGGLSLLTVGLCCEEVTAYGGSLIADLGAAACIGMLIYTASPSKLWSGESGSMLIGALFAASVAMSGMELLFLLAALPQTADLAVAAFNHVRYKKTPLPQRGDISPRRPLRIVWREKGAGDYAVMLLFLTVGLIGAVLSFIFAVYAEGFLFLVY